MTTISTYLAASLVAVTFGWVPAERAGESQSPEGYDYLVQLSPEDLEALRAGRAVDLVSELPTDIGPIERVRVLVGDGDVPQLLRERDRLSPRRLSAASSTAQAHTVAKPVVPEWQDAARLVADDQAAGETAERRTAFQNPTSLQQGFEQATKPLAEAGKWVESQSKNLADGTAQFLESLAPGGAGDPYSSRPQQSTQSTVPPPQASTSPQQAQFQQSYPPSTYPPSTYPPATYPPSTYPQQGNPPSTYPSNTPAVRNTVDLPPPPNDLVERFAGEADRFGATSQQALSPVPRTDDRQVTGFGSSPPPATSTQPNAWDAFSSPPAGSFAAQTTPTQGGAPRSDAFPTLRSAENGGLAAAPTSETLSWDTRFGSAPPATATGGGFASERAGANPAPAGADTRTPSTGWAGDQTASPTSGSAANPPAPTAASERSLLEGVIMVALGAGMCFTWIAYIDVRNKYLSVLRAAPGSGYSTAA